MLKQNQRGVTLIELLVVITILSLVGTLIWSVFIQGKEFTNAAMTKNQIQQEANYIMIKLTKIHQTSSEYRILNNSPDSGSFTVEDKETGTTEIFSHSRMNFFIEQSVENPIHPEQNSVEVKLTITDKEDTKNILTLETLLYRLKGGNSNE